MTEENNVNPDLSKQTKPWWKSKGVMGSLAVVIASIMQRFGLDVDQASLTEIMLNISTLIGGAIALYGRVVAELRIRKGESE